MPDADLHQRAERHEDDPPVRGLPGILGEWMGENGEREGAGT